MKKSILGLSLVTILHAQSYEDLLNRAIENSAVLHNSKQQIEYSTLEGEINTRLANPNIELEVANFSSGEFLGDSSVGMRTGITQEIMLPWVKDKKQKLTQREVTLSQANHSLNKLAFIYQFNRYYSFYKKSVEKERLGDESIALSTEIFRIANERFKAGGIAKHELLQAKIEQHNAVTKQKELELQTLKAKNRLLLYANLDTSVSIDTNHQFGVLKKNSLHPILEVTKAKEEVANSSLQIAQNSIEGIEFYSEIEREPDQDIIRFGLSLPLAISHTKAEEKQLAKIELQRQKFTFQAQEKSLRLELEQLKKEIVLDQEMIEHYETVLKEQQELLKIYEQGYRIAKVNLLKLNTLKQTLLSNKEQRLEHQFMIEEKQIKIAYLKGADNE